MNFLFDHLPLKLASVGLATLLWFVIAGEKTSERGLTVGVELQNVPKDLELTGEPTNTVEVRLRASPGVIQRLTPGDVAARIDLAGAEEGERIVHLTPDNIRLPFGVRVVKITPSILTMHFDRTQQKLVPIRGRIIGRPAPGYEVAEVTAEPAEVTVAGPRSRVQELESAFSEPVSVEGGETTVQEEVSIGLEDPLLRILGRPRVRVSVRIREVHEARTFGGLAVEVRGGRGTLRPARVSVSVTGPVSVLRRMQPEHVHPYVDVSQARDGSLPVAVELSPGHAGVTVKELKPAQVMVRGASGRGGRG